MRAMTVAFLALMVSAAAHAGEVSLKFEDSAQSAILQLPGQLDNCVAGLTIRGDATGCRAVSNFLTAIGNEIRTAQSAAAKAAADKAVADEAAKKTTTPKK
jgi:hypothetical protein